MKKRRRNNLGGVMNPHQYKLDQAIKMDWLYVR